MKHRFSFLLILVLLFPSKNLFSNEPVIWNDIKPIEAENISKRSSMPGEYRSLSLDLDALKSQLDAAPDENIPNAYLTGAIIDLPLPDGSFSKFRVVKSKVMHEDLAAQFPGIQTFSAKGITDPTATAKLDFTQWGFHAMIISQSGWFFIDPAILGNTGLYLCFDKKHSVATENFICETQAEIHGREFAAPPVLNASSGGTLRTYRLALACTGEYAAFFGGTVPGAMSAMATTVNRVNGVYELEVAVRMVLIANNNLLVYTNSATDPYTNGSGTTMLGENQSNITSVIGSANYDFGHVVSTGGGGVASLGVICSSSFKARGVTGSGAPVGDGFDIDYVAHEMGHQFSGNHTFNSVTGSCSGNRNGSTAYENGSGTTIMAYAGICGADDIQPHSDAIFYTKSYDEIIAHITSGGGSTCPSATSTGNTAPAIVSVGSNYTIPLSTSFILTGSATDANGDAITYLWEEFDTGPAGAPNSPSGNAPIFRDFVPTTNPSRTFPRIQDIVRNTQTIGEILPSYARSLQFRLTVRDNRAGGGGVTHNDTPVTLTVSNTTTPFKVTSPNTAVTWPNNSTQTVTWDVSSTNVAPINCANVNILLSVDSGYTFPFTLLSATPNDGSQVVTIPNVTSNKARIKVEAVGNIFFDFSNVNFTISSSSPILTIITTSPLSTNSYCAGGAVNVPFTTDGPANAGNVFTAELSNSGGSFASPVSIGTLSSVNSGTINATIPGGTAAGSGYRIRVVSSNPVVTGSDNGSNISIFLVPAAAGSISGPSTVCQGQTGVVYSVSTIANATTYNWTLLPGMTVTTGANTSSITVSVNSATTGNISVAGANGGCTGTSSSTPVTVSLLPSAAGNISGTSIVCQGQSGVSYSIAPVSGATGYQWVLPGGVTIGSGSNTNSITVNYSMAAISGTISVRGTNACGNGAYSNSFNVYVNPVPASPSISAGGPTAICGAGSVTLSFTPSAGIAYQWRKNGVNIPGQTASSYNATSVGTYDVAATFIPAGPQTLSNNNRSFIPDNTCPGGATGISVSGYNGLVNTSQITMRINVTHTWVGDLVIMMETPEGSLVGLSNRTGNTNNSGDNFTNTVFSDAGATAIPGSGAPYPGIYKPVQTSFSDCFGPTITSFATIGSGFINPNGDWNLGVFDRAAQDTGSIWNWSISFPAGLQNNCAGLSNQIVVTTAPTVVPSVTIAAGPGNDICSGTNVTFTTMPVNGGSAPSYQWKIDGTNVGTNNSVFNSTSLANGQILSCEMTSNESCASPTTATSNEVTMIVRSAPSINSFSPLAGSEGSSVIISGAAFTDATGVSFNGNNALFTFDNDGELTATVPAGATTGTISVTTPCGTAFSSSAFNVVESITLNVKVFIEGFMTNGGQLTEIVSPGICDTISVSLAQDVSPFAILYSDTGVIDINGDGSFTFPGAAFGNSFYIVINHRNALETWSTIQLLSSASNSYDFTTNSSKAFGNNMVLSNGVYAIMSGDVNQDGMIDDTDIESIISGTQSFMTGYEPEDLTGDNISEASDLSVVENNLLKMILRP